MSQLVLLLLCTQLPAFTADSLPCTFFHGDNHKQLKSKYHRSHG